MLFTLLARLAFEGVRLCGLDEEPRTIDECKRACIENGCAGFTHFPNNLTCTLYSSIRGARLFDGTCVDSYLFMDRRRCPEEEGEKDLYGCITPDCNRNAKRRRPLARFGNTSSTSREADNNNINNNNSDSWVPQGGGITEGKSNGNNSSSGETWRGTVVLSPYNRAGTRTGHRTPDTRTTGTKAKPKARPGSVSTLKSGEFDRTGDSAGSSEAALNIDIGQLEREINADARESRRIVFKGSGLPADQHSDWTSTSSFGTPSWTTTSWTSRSTSTSSSTTPQMTTTSPPTTTSTTTTSTTIPPRTTTIPLLTTTSTSTSTTTPTTTLAITTTTTPFMIVCPNGTRTTPKQFMPMDSVSIKGNGKQNRRDRGVMRKEECESIAQRECLQGYLMADNGTCFTLDTVDGFTRGGEPNIEDSFVSDEVDASFVRNLRKRCDPNKYNHFQYIFKSGPENIMYSFIPVNKSMYAKMGYKGRRSRYSCYYYRRKLCQETCPRSHTFFVKSAKDLENAATAIAEYNRMAPPEMPSLRQFNMGFYFAPNNRSTWEDGSPYHPTVWPSFPGSTRRINAHSCVNFNYKTGKPYLGSCYVEYDVALCEHRCTNC